MPASGGVSLTLHTKMYGLSELLQLVAGRADHINPERRRRNQGGAVPVFEPEPAFDTAHGSLPGDLDAEFDRQLLKVSLLQA